MPGLVGGGAPERHHRVADELIDVARRRLDRLDDVAEVAVRHLHQHLGRYEAREGGEARDVGEHHGHFPSFAAEPQRRGIGREAGDDGGRDIVTECPLDVPAGALLDEITHHVGEDRRPHEPPPREGLR